ncbi:MAG: hypothetical protein WBQ94_14245 [Terracidiphilus sp.]
MEHLVIREAPRTEQGIVEHWAEFTPDGDLLDSDIFAHASTFLLSAMRSGEGTVAYLPVQQPLMLENLIFRPNLTDRERALAMTRLAEYAISEAYRRDVGELYFLCREESTCRFAEHHKFVRIDGPESELKLKIYRLNLLETFGA